MSHDNGSFLGSATQRIALVAAMGGLLAGAPVAATAEVGLPRFPSISPDGSELVFSWRGDLWRAPTDGGEAIRLTRHDLDDLYSSWSPDGEWVVFSSMRDGYLNLWRMRRDGGELTQLTHGDQHLRNPSYGVDEDGEPVITFSGMLEADVYRDQRPYQLSPEGGEYRRLHDAFGSEPQLSPDGQRVAFTRGGAYHGWNRRHYRGPDAMNVWLHDRETDAFEALTERDGDDGSARWIDNETLLFMSDREDETVNLYRAELGNEARTFDRLTDFDERDLQHFDISHDGSTAILQVWDTLLTLDLEAPDAEPEPVPLRAAADGRDDHELRRINRDVSEAALSPDGQTMAYVAYGRVYVRHMDEQSPTRPVTPGTHARHKDIAWSPDGLALYFVNDTDGTESIHQARVALTRDEIRQTHERLSPDERPSRDWELTAPSPVEPAMPAPEEPVEPDPEANDEPDIALQGEDPADPFAPQDPGFLITPILLPTTSPPVDVPEPLQDQPIQAESIPEEELDVEVPEEVPPERDPTRWHDAVQFHVEPLVASEHNDRQVSPSPDGRSLAFRRGRGDLMIMNLASEDKRTLVEGWDSFTHWRWSPDSRYIAFSRNDLNFSANIFIVPADGSEAPVNITRHPRNDLSPRWSADGRKLSFISNRSGDSYDLYSVYLDRVIETYTPRERTAYYRNARNEADDRSPLPVMREETQEPDTVDEPALELENAWRRVERITASPAHNSANEMTPGGDRYVFNEGSEGLYVMDWDGGNRTRLGSIANVQHLSTTGDRVVYISDGRVGVARLSGGTHQRPDISDRIRIDLQEQSLQKFNEAARMIGESFYREDMKGLDWPQVVEDYETLIRRARTPSEFSDISNRLMGELAASHMGVTNPGPVSALREPSGRLGIEQERMVSQADGRAGYRVTEVIPEGRPPAAPCRSGRATSSPRSTSSRSRSAIPCCCGYVAASTRRSSSPSTAPVTTAIPSTAPCWPRSA
ncbi:PD40 domain-containing protein [Halomonas sp. BC04]|uniref:PD40 domain-containing protein n=1 Tax=Halomonas sp. BC04 TaxID=1403540 RepID=UPI0018CC1BCC|nr:PD40 domain-containing protein [Halomonas sp. BC04]